MNKMYLSIDLFIVIVYNSVVLYKLYK